MRLLARCTSLSALVSSMRPLFVHGSFTQRDPHFLQRHGCRESVSRPFSPVRSGGIHEICSRLLHGPTFAHLVNGDADPRKKLTQDALRKLAKSGRSWRRLGHLVDLACFGDVEHIRTIADVGCDHGLLAISLSLSGRFERVVGVDASERALQDGAITLYQKLLDTLHTEERWWERDEHVNSDFSVEFRVGNGLEALQPGEADAVCIAGMGVDSMIEILEADEINRVGCKKLILQPTNARPRNLLRLYDCLALIGWGVSDESIEYLSTRWYISASFEQQTIDDNRPREPGHFLVQLGDETPMKQVYAKYVGHHQSWIKKDARSRGVHDNDKRWLAAIRGECA